MYRSPSRPSLPMSLLVVSTLLAGLSACSHELKGLIPLPERLEPGGECGDGQPQLVCSEQLVTTVHLCGEGFSPLVADTLSGDGAEVLLPELTLQRVSDVTGTPASGEPVPLDASGVRWSSQEDMSFDVAPELGLEPGVYDLLVENASGSSGILAEALVVLPPPSLDTVQPQLMCSEQLDNVITLTGSGFVELADGTMPTVTVGGLSLTPTSISDCADLAGPAGGRTCETLTATIPAGALEPGVLAVIVTNPSPAGCVSTEVVLVELVPPPTLDHVDPQLFCSEQFDVELTLIGTGFIELADGTLPTVDVGGVVVTTTGTADCTELQGPAGGRSCSTLNATVPAGTLQPGVHAVTVTNPSPAGCVTTEQIYIEVVPPPTLASVEPELFCSEQSDTALTLTGTGFIQLADGTLPSVSVGGVVVTTTSISGCTDLLGPAGGRSCTTLVATVAAGALQPGVYAVTVTNPASTGCVTEEEVYVEVVPPPTLDSVEPQLFCSEQVAAALTLHGSGFIRLADGTLPTVTVGGVVITTNETADCTPLLGPAGGHTCDTLMATVPPGSVGPGLHAVQVTNPAPAGCTSNDTVQVEVVPPPSVSAVVPDPICTEQFSQQILVQGAGFLVVDGQAPTVTIDGAAYPVDSFQGCTALTLVPSVQTCTELTVTLAQGSLGAGNHSLTVRNPDPAPCTNVTAFTFTVVPPPLVDHADPSTTCAGGGQFTIYGSGFQPGASVLVGGAAPTSVTVISSYEIFVTMAFNLLPGTYDVVVTNPDGCSGTLAGAITVIPGPIVFFVDPPYLYNGITIQVTIYASGLTGTPTALRLVNTSTTQVFDITEYSWNPAKPNRVLANIPAGLPAGGYDVVLEDPGGCPAILSAGVTVVDTLTIAIESMLPGFGHQPQTTDVEIRAMDPPPAGMVQFYATPRAYLNPAEPGPNTVATPLASVAFVGDPTQPSALLTAVVPSGLPLGYYDLIVVNPDGTVGQLEDAFRVLSEPPPTIDTISPGSGVNNADTPGTIFGAGYRDPEVTMDCQEPDDTVTHYTVSVTTWDATTIEVIFPTNGVPEGSVCVITVTNPDDGSFGQFSALAVTNPSANLAPWSSAQPLLTGRRAPVALAGRATQTSRFLHAIGGDSGTVASAMTSVESATVDMYGNVGAWFEQPYPLPEPRTLAGGVRIGRFLYLVGGNDGVSAVRSVLRSEILDPLDAPEITDLAITTGSASGLAGGIWYYRVSARFGPADDRNPDGESLASDPMVVHLPSLPDEIHLTLFWSAVQNAVGYRVYRSPGPNLASGSEELIAEVGATTSYTDTGTSSLEPVIKPLPFGTLGRWREITTAQLGTAREGFGIALGSEPGQSVDPDNPTASAYYIYAIGGRDAGGTVLASYEYLPILVNSPKSHTVGAWIDGTIDLSAARWQLGAYTMTAFSSPAVPDGETWVYAASGRTAGALSAAVEAAQVQPGGALGPAWQTVTSFTPSRAGYGYAGINDRLFAFGGNGGNASNESMAAQLCSPGLPACGVKTFPNHTGFNNEGTNMSVARVLMGSTLESAFIFIVGGWTGTAATNAVDCTTW